MTDRTITFTLPEAVYRRAEEAAIAASLSLEDVFIQSLDRLLPPLKNDLPQSLRADPSVYSLKSDEQK